MSRLSSSVVKLPLCSRITQSLGFSMPDIDGVTTLSRAVREASRLVHQSLSGVFGNITSASFLPRPMDIVLAEISEDPETSDSIRLTIKRLNDDKKLMPLFHDVIVIYQAVNSDSTDSNESVQGALSRIAKTVAKRREVMGRSGARKNLMEQELLIHSQGRNIEHAWEDTAHKELWIAFSEDRNTEIRSRKLLDIGITPDTRLKNLHPRTVLTELRCRVTHGIRKDLFNRSVAEPPKEETTHGVGEIAEGLHAGRTDRRARDTHNPALYAELRDSVCSSPALKCKFQGLDHSETAEELGISPEASRKRLQRERELFSEKHALANCSK